MGFSFMKSKLLFVAALLVPGLAYGSSANLSVQIVPAQGLPGSILPPGNWTIGFDDEFNGTNVDASKWTAIPADGTSWLGGTMWCHSGGMSVSGGTLKIGNQGGGVNGSDTLAGCYIATPYSYGAGYFEARMRMNDTNGWGAFWTFAAPNADCGGTIAQNGYEGDVSENNFGNSINALHYNGYGSCHVGPYHTLPLVVYDGYFHIFGMDVGDNGCLTYYLDGAQTFQTCPGNIGNPLAEIILSNSSNPLGYTTMEVDWVRWYHH
jgi:hypothetical protein